MKILITIFIGLFAGVLDLIPLFFVNAPLFNMLSIVAFWLVATYIISITKVVKNSILNGLIISVLLMLPMALAVSATNPKDFIPMLSMAIILGPFVGYSLGRVNSKKGSVRI
ncbi:hypothetical protein EW093_08455 [Thiospirochaeta perfilievii]|uniref:DUF1097 domain-containing protein n=1 Tax=Thiospirochaeta perfilievii TaxID=252967 RepID=A0A5C1QB64_9SPIO|nr:hypothetical protein [Thiospirochaeta perfilievii]QEN04737.1 hypothetical protein EW093_08455 [Thiospirochaeta perfilievii]